MDVTWKQGRNFQGMEGMQNLKKKKKLGFQWEFRRDSEGTRKAGKEYGRTDFRGNSERRMAFDVLSEITS